LGADILNHQGDPVVFGGKGLREVDHISISRMDTRLKDCTFDIACDVKNPLIGSQGASYIYGPQKGADANTVSILDQAMEKYGDILKRDLQADVTDVEGAGAAGGLGAAFLAFLHAKLYRGIDLIATITNIEN